MDSGAERLIIINDAGNVGISRQALDYPRPQLFNVTLGMGLGDQTTLDCCIGKATLQVGTCIKFQGCKLHTAVSTN